MDKLAKQITLHHLVISGQKMIGLKFYPDKVIHALIKGIPDASWSKAFSMVVLPNRKANVDLIFRLFKGVAWINCTRFYTNRPVRQGQEAPDVDWYRKRTVPPGYRTCPESFLQKLELRKYATNTVRTYVCCFEKFINHYRDKDLDHLDENDIRQYLQLLIQENCSDSLVNQMINSIKFYFEVVQDMPNRYYDIERPRKQARLPEVLSKTEVICMIDAVRNIKHRCILSLLYSAGLRRSELLNLKLIDIDSHRMLIKVNHGKGRKDRLTLLSTKMLGELRQYYKSYRPKIFLFEGLKGQRYTASSVAKIVRRAAGRAGIKRKVTPHTLRHSFATHLLEEGTDIRYIQSLLGHHSSKTTEIYTHVAANAFAKIKNPLDLLTQ